MHTTVNFLTLNNERIPVLNADNDISIGDWCSNNKALVQNLYSQYGVVLFRDFEVNHNDDFSTFARNFMIELMDYHEPSTPRTRIGENLFTSTEYPSHLSIPLHNENSYTSDWPMKVFFYCAQPAESGGETPIANSHHVYEQIDPKIRAEFETRGLMYVRNYSQYLDVKWQDVFKSSDRHVVEEYCKKNKMEYEWKENGILKTRKKSIATLTHPVNNSKIWFNQAHLFHVSNLEPTVRKYLMERYGEDSLPRNCYFADGAPIPDSVLNEIRSVYDKCQIIFPWKQKDILLVDNILFAHGRKSFKGSRKVLVILGEAFSKYATA